MKIALIAAMAKNRVIGVKNRLPWHLSADLKRFRNLTMGKPILMGRKTFESIGKPLPGRINVIVSRNSSYNPEGCIIYDSVKSAMDGLEKQPMIFVIGGASLYHAFFPLAELLYLTLIHQEFKGDTFFPEIDLDAWHIEEQENFFADGQTPFDYSFLVYQKNKSR